MNIKTTTKYFIIVITALMFVPAIAQQQSQDKTKEQVDALIKQTGETKPDWWNSVELEFPAILDMNWPIQQGVWNGRPGSSAIQLPPRQAAFAAIETLENQVAELRTQIENAPDIDPNIAALQGTSLTEFMDVYTPEINTINQIQQTLSLLTDRSVSSNTAGINSATVNELISLAQQDNATELSARLEELAQQVQAGARGGGGERGARGAGPAQIPTNVDQYLMQIVYPNQAQHKQGIKLVSQFAVMQSNKFEKYKRDINTLAYMYYDLVFDYARAAYWWQRYAELGGAVDELKLARCYYELGSTSAAAEILTQAGNSNEPGNNNRDIIKLWATIGDVDKALSMIESEQASSSAGERGGPGGGNRQLQNNMMLAGEICRQAGRFDQAIDYYQKVIDAQQAEQSNQQQAPAGGRGGVNYRSLPSRAAANIETLKLLKELDITTIPDGSYTGTGYGHEGALTLTATVKSGRIESIEVTERNETPGFYANAEKVTRRIVSKQGFIEVDAVTGATESSDAIINAAAKALADAVR